MPLFKASNLLSVGRTRLTHLVARCGSCTQDAGAEDPQESTAQTAESGNAMIEFIVLGLMLLLPTVYFLLAVFSVQSAALAANAASSAAVQYAQSTPREQLSATNVSQVAQMAASDYKIPPDSTSIVFNCVADCSASSAVQVTVTVEAQVPLIPWIAPGGFAELSSTAVGWGGKYQ
ncbi:MULTISPECIES: hypothetical protein [unclassified Rothia (in: high G+C Gram-positive bacteria)]|uniref:hypothetical protein n=1 Tax=unclassified Rothia (in: high G+C Gram-positive bacteria) TaxID=2689056 RepID=UPI00195DE8D1|nr:MULTISPECIES: hypothetical protein [unclassified Rothia (in: high G+C Gram-positive bacteria)]MBM7051035.1 hypothetical protein [Rothia sp. ZJ1223]QRZ62260.1 hypothetical protein JR346_03900 [Rothia sp. ZJ932]